MARPPQTTSTQPRKTGSPRNDEMNSFSKGPTREQIAKRAYEIYLGRNGAPGNPDDDWIQAERELRLGRY